MDLKKVGAFLASYFHDFSLKDGVQMIKLDLERYPEIEEEWSALVQIVRNHNLGPGEVLKLVNESANKVLDENSDTEAYMWLELLVKNVTRTDGKFEDY